MLPAVFGLAPARVVMFDTICEFRAAIGTCGFAAGLGGGGGDAAGLIREDFETGASVSVEILGFEVAGGGMELDLAAGAVLVDAASAGDGCCEEAFLASTSLNCCNILEDAGSSFADTDGFSGVGAGLFPSGCTGSACFAVFEGSGAFDAVFGAAELAIGFGAGFLGAGAFADALLAAFVTFGAAFVDFARDVVVFLVSGNSTSTGSIMTFLGLPLFLATSADILSMKLGD